MADKNFMLILCGQEQSGKSHTMKKIIEKYVQTKGTALIYNIGREADFPATEYETIEVLSFREHLQYIYKSKNEAAFYKKNQKIEFFKWNNSIFHFAEFNRIFWKKKVRMYRITSSDENNEFFKALFLYCGNTLFGIDDSRHIFRNGLRDGHIELFSRKNHCGVNSTLKNCQGAGIDVITAWHNLDHINSDIWDYSTHLQMFASPINPSLSKIDNAQLEKLVMDSRSRLETLPPYYSININVQGIPVANEVRPLPYP